MTLNLKTAALKIPYVATEDGEKDPKTKKKGQKKRKVSEGAAAAAGDADADPDSDPDPDPDPNAGAGAGAVAGPEALAAEVKAGDLVLLRDEYAVATSSVGMGIMKSVLRAANEAAADPRVLQSWRDMVNQSELNFPPFL